MVVATKPPCSVFMPAGCEEKENKEEEKTLSPDSDENNEGGRFIQCGAVC